MTEIIVNGKRYDAETGQLLDAPENILNFDGKNFAAEKFHQKTQKSQTLNRRFVRAPEEKVSKTAAIEQFKRRHDYAEIRKLENLAEAKKSHDGISKSNLRRSSERVISPVSRVSSEGISKKANEISARGKAIDGVSKSMKVEKSSDDTDLKPYEIHPIQARAIEQIRARNSERVLPSMAEIKQNAIASALNQMSKTHASQEKSAKKARRAWWIFGGIGAVAILVGAGVALNLPQISARMAGAQGGFSADLPQYSPEGYKLKSLPYFDGKSIVMRFSKDSQNYEIKQVESTWDSQALLENYVLINWGKDYQTYLEKGLTIYRNSKNSAVWINGGKFYQILAAEELSEAEILKIATSF